MLSARIASACAAAGVADLPALLGRLRFRLDDITDTVAVVARIEGDPAAHAAWEELAWRIEQHGNRSHLEPLFSDEQCAARLGYARGVLPLVAFVSTVAFVVDRNEVRYGDRDCLLDSLADLGQQVWVHRRVYGQFGLTNENWVAVAWSGNLVWLGRLQYSIARGSGSARDQCTSSLGYFAHIPEDGPLDTASVQQSLDMAAAWLPWHFPEVLDSEQRVREVATQHFPIYCASWLLAPCLRELLPDSNIVRFAERFGEPVQCCDDNRDAIYFTWRREPPVDLADLPRRTRLEQRLGAYLDQGLRVGRWLGKIEV